MKILVMGAGAVGAYYGARLQQAGEEVVFCARGENLRVLREGGLEVKSFKGDFSLRVTATSRPAEFAPYDLVLFCVKTYDTEDAARELAGCLAPQATVLTLQNGVENEAVLAGIFGADAVMAGNARVNAELAAPGKLIHITTGVIQFGPLDGRLGERARRVAAVFERAGILGELTPRMRMLRWEKLLWNGAFNPVTALSRRCVGDVIDTPEGLATVRALMREIVAVARAEGAELSEADIERQIGRSFTQLRAVRPSTLQDLERGKRLEHDALTGAVIRAARRRGIPVPVTETVHALLNLLDRYRESSVH
ncbi:MAG TPA: 2-dehydropantoate 2-reductase [Candidatus Binataceae bacterium]|jgi:2-dehydropantoate 2-reductase|nr:2-dehydropantoate 2-reductase [Candidatus Binataceae bacterium]